MATSLQFIKSVTGTASEVNVTDCFNDRYNVYKVIIPNYENSSATTNYNIRLLDSSGNRIADSEYDYATYILDSNVAFSDYNGTNNSFLRYFPVTNSSYNVGVGTVIYVFNPSDSSSYTSLQWQGVSWQGSKLYGYKSIGIHKSAEQITGIEMYANSGTMINAKISVYGVK
jgi:hypothetical protein|tara:strand:- start:176 stop:688 length:513 start_codon:yes stop_codon:yes gene_type:complete